MDDKRLINKNLVDGLKKKASKLKLAIDMYNHGIELLQPKQPELSAREKKQNLEFGKDAEKKYKRSQDKKNEKRDKKKQRIAERAGRRRSDQDEQQQPQNNELSRESSWLHSIADLEDDSDSDSDSDTELVHGEGQHVILLKNTLSSFPPNYEGSLYGVSMTFMFLCQAEDQATRSELRHVFRKAGLLDTSTSNTKDRGDNPYMYTFVNNFYAVNSAEIEDCLQKVEGWKKKYSDDKDLVNGLNMIEKLATAAHTKAGVSTRDPEVTRKRYLSFIANGLMTTAPLKNVYTGNFVKGGKGSEAEKKMTMAIEKYIFEKFNETGLRVEGESSRFECWQTFHGKLYCSHYMKHINNNCSCFTMFF